MSPPFRSLHSSLTAADQGEYLALLRLVGLFMVLPVVVEEGRSSPSIRLLFPRHLRPRGFQCAVPESWCHGTPISRSDSLLRDHSGRPGKYANGSSSGSPSQDRSDVSPSKTVLEPYRVLPLCAVESLWHSWQRSYCSGGESNLVSTTSSHKARVPPEEPLIGSPP
jgi:hypothetical protein